MGEKKVVVFNKNKYLVTITFNLIIENHQKWVDIEAILLGYGFTVNSRFICMGEGKFKKVKYFKIVFVLKINQVFEYRYWWRKVWPMYQRLCPRSRLNSRSPSNEQDYSWWWTATGKKSNLIMFDPFWSILIHYGQIWYNLTLIKKWN